MDDEAFQRFVKMTDHEFNRYINKGLTMVEVMKVTGRRKRAQNNERQRRQREIEY